MKVVVTGGAGFIGSHLSERLVEDGHEVTVVDSLVGGSIQNLEKVQDSIRFIEEDIREAGSWQLAIKESQVVFHLAALADIVPSIQRPMEYFSTNVYGTGNVLECVRTTGARVIYAASSSCYGIPDLFPTPEEAAIRPEYPYALTKWLGEEMVLHWGKVYGIPVVSLRLFNVYGPRSRTSSAYGAVMGVFLAQKISGKPLTVVGNGEQTRDFTFVTDVVDAFVRASTYSGSRRVFNVGSGRTVSINTLAGLIGGQIVHIPRRPGEPDCTYADTSKITAALSWQPIVELEDGISVLTSQIEQWRNAPVWTPETIAEATKDWFEHLGRNE